MASDEEDAVDNGDVVPSKSKRKKKKSKKERRASISPQDDDDQKQISKSEFIENGETHETGAVSSKRRKSKHHKRAVFDDSQPDEISYPILTPSDDEDDIEPDAERPDPHEPVTPMAGMKQETTAHLPDTIGIQTIDDNRLSLIHPSRFNSDDLFQVDLLKLAALMQGNGGIQTSTSSVSDTEGGVFHFMGEEAVTWISRRLQISRDQAVTVGQMMHHAHVLLPIDRSVKEFTDSWTIYALLSIADLDKFLLPSEVAHVMHALRGPLGPIVKAQTFGGQVRESAFKGKDALQALPQALGIDSAERCSEILDELLCSGYIYDVTPDISAQTPFTSEGLYMYKSDHIPSIIFNEEMLNRLYHSSDDIRANCLYDGARVEVACEHDIIDWMKQSFADYSDVRGRYIFNNLIHYGIAIKTDSLVTEKVLKRPGSKRYRFDQWGKDSGRFVKFCSEDEFEDIKEKFNPSATNVFSSPTSQDTKSGDPKYGVSNRRNKIQSVASTIRRQRIRVASYVLFLFVLSLKVLLTNSDHLHEITVLFQNTFKQFSAPDRSSDTLDGLNDIRFEKISNYHDFSTWFSAILTETNIQSVGIGCRAFGAIRLKAILVPSITCDDVVGVSECYPHYHITSSTNEWKEYVSFNFSADQVAARRNAYTRIDQLLKDDLRQLDVNINYFNPNDDRIISVTLLVAFSSHGFVQTDIIVFTHTITKHTLQIIDYFIIVAVLPLVFDMVSSIDSIYAFRSFGTWIAFLKIAALCSGLISQTITDVGVSFDKVRDSYQSGSHFDSSDLQYVQYLMESFMVWAVFLSFMDFLRFISFHPKIKQITAIFVKTLKEISFAVIIAAFIFVGFSITFYLLLAPDQENFQSLRDTTLTLVEVVFGKFNLDYFRGRETFLGTILMLIYVTFFMFVIVNIFVMVLLRSHEYSKQVAWADDKRLVSRYTMMGDDSFAELLERVHHIAPGHSSKKNKKKTNQGKISKEEDNVIAISLGDLAPSEIGKYLTLSAENNVQAQQLAMESYKKADGDGSVSS